MFCLVNVRFLLRLLYIVYSKDTTSQDCCTVYTILLCIELNIRPFMSRDTHRHVTSVASPAQKVGVRTIFLCCWAVKSYNIHAWDTPPTIYKTLFNGFAQISGGVWTEVWGRHCVTSSLKRLTSWYSLMTSPVDFCDNAWYVFTI